MAYDEVLDAFEGEMGRGSRRTFDPLVDGDVFVRQFVPSGASDSFASQAVKFKSDRQVVD